MDPHTDRHPDTKMVASDPEKPISDEEQLAALGHVQELRRQYHWVHCLSPPSYRSTAAWFTGWVSIGGQLVLSASAAFAAGLQLQALITLNNLDTYVPLRWQGMLFYWAILAYSTAVNVWGSKILPHTNLIAGKKPPAVKKLPEIDV
ncbi:hypothetical protein N7509_004523 [Penicillium cosmopolitanum]|uniref:Uncharacterized protein n=1 Tax=Penicillium cosmopolitanum TaxID=1131564 RepID=A0A9W9W0H5_9EURO|nr:uncharacterized protein N7509_004523 [Penicillium cosmopolitanum]KAJ5396410.1 hypothetical protein N7509_004523 [Penicillium cosmopolitanum]